MYSWLVLIVVVAIWVVCSIFDLYPQHLKSLWLGKVCL